MPAPEMTSAQIEGYSSVAWFGQWVIHADNLIRGQPVEPFITETARYSIMFMELKANPVRFDLSQEEIGTLKAVKALGTMATAASDTDALSIIQNEMKILVTRLGWNMPSDTQCQVEQTLVTIWKEQKEGLDVPSRKSLLATIRHASNNILDYISANANLSQMLNPDPDSYRARVLARLTPVESDVAP